MGTAFTVNGGSNVRIAGCTIRNAGQLGLEVDGGTNHTVQSCNIHHNGTGGLHIKGGDRKTLTPSGHHVVNNRIYRVSERMRTGAYNILVGGVGVTMTHNEIYEAPHQAILLYGNDHLFELNNIHHVGMASGRLRCVLYGEKSVGSRHTHPPQLLARDRQRHDPREVAQFTLTTETVGQTVHGQPCFIKHRGDASAPYLITVVTTTGSLIIFLLSAIKRSARHPGVMRIGKNGLVNRSGRRGC